MSLLKQFEGHGRLRFIAMVVIVAMICIGPVDSLQKKCALSTRTGLKSWRRIYSADHNRLIRSFSTKLNEHNYDGPKKRQKDILRSAEGIPIVPVKAARPSMYKPIVSGGSKPKRIMPQGKPREMEIINPNKLRIVAGTAKGKKLESPKVYLRPMMAKVREALFSTLDFMGVFETNTTRILDTFAGSGSVGLEALSRGAAHATFVDLSPNCIETAQRNAAHCGFEGRATAVCARAEEVLTEPAKFGLTEPYTLISITPPYEEVIYKTLIDALCNSPLVVEDTLVLIEYPVEMGTLPYILGEDKLFGIRNRRYGRTVLSLYVYRPNKKHDMRPDEFVSIK